MIPWAMCDCTTRDIKQQWRQSALGFSNKPGTDKNKNRDTGYYTVRALCGQLHGKESINKSHWKMHSEAEEEIKLISGFVWPLVQKWLHLENLLPNSIGEGVWGVLWGCAYKLLKTFRYFFILEGVWSTGFLHLLMTPTLDIMVNCVIYRTSKTGTNKGHYFKIQKFSVCHSINMSYEIWHCHCSTKCHTNCFDIWWSYHHNQNTNVLLLKYEICSKVSKHGFQTNFLIKFTNYQLLQF